MSRLSFDVAMRRQPPVRRAPPAWQVFLMRLALLGIMAGATAYFS
jgi:hypothetical protein